MPISRRSCTSCLSQFRNAAWSYKEAIFSGLISEWVATRADGRGPIQHHAHAGAPGEELVHLRPSTGRKYLFLFLFAFPFGHRGLKHVFSAASSCLHAAAVLAQDRVSKVCFVFNHAKNPFFDGTSDH